MAESKRIAISGATGMVGSALSKLLRDRGDVVIPISRSERPGGIQWDVDKGELPAQPLEGLDAIVHLAGAGIADERWTSERKRIIRESRVKSCDLLTDAMKNIQSPPKRFISASGVGYYGPNPNGECDEDTPPGPGFLADVCREWEAAAMKAEETGANVAIARLGVVLDPEGGALARMLPVFRLGGGGPVGNGKQRLGWVTLDDVARAFQFLIDHPEAVGAFNVAAPQIVTNKEFADALGDALNRPTVLPAPRFALKLAFGELVDETLLADAPAIPKRLLAHGFEFRYPKLDAALKHIL